MPISLEVLRLVMGGLSAVFAHLFGRSVGLFSKGRERRRPLITWALRFTLTAAAVSYFGIDRLAIIVLVLDILLFALGWWDEWRPKHQEDLTRQMFPDDDNDDESRERL